MDNEECREQGKIRLMSKSNVEIYGNFDDTLIKGNCPAWPPAEILQKLYGRAKNPKLKDGNGEECKDSKLGYFCDLQSNNSEDSLTWNFFGTLSHELPKRQTKVTNKIVEMCEKGNANTEVEISLFRRLPHPDTHIQSGPEIDVLINGNNVILLIECKWNSQVGKNQGKNKDQDQLDIRLKLKDFLEIVTGKKVYVVLLSKKSELNIKKGVFSITWDDIIGFHPLKEVKDAYSQKK